MKELKLTNSDKVATVDDEDYDRIVSICDSWYLLIIKERDAAIRSTKRFGYLTHFNYWYLPRLIMKEDKKYILIDHKDNNIFNNLKINLRRATFKQNVRNRLKHRNSSSKYKGVFLRKDNGKFRSIICFNYVNISLGQFDTEIEAAVAYDDKAIELYGEFAKLNFQLYGA